MRHRDLVVYVLLGYLMAQAGFFAVGQLPGLGGAPAPADAPGCPDADDFTPATVTGLPVAVHVMDTFTRGSHFVAEWTGAGDPRTDRLPNVTVVSSRAEMNETMLSRREVDGDHRYPGAVEFLNGTDFGTASLVVFAFPHTSTPDVHVESAMRVGDGVDLWLPEPGPGHDGDSVVETVFVCVSFDAGGASVRSVHGHRAST